MKDLFTGSLGKLNNHGGSRIFTTPNTREVKPEYEIATGIPKIAEFAACSLDGRLWAFRRSKRYYIAVLRWNEDIQQLAFVSVVVLNNINIIGRGVDWLLTDTAIIQASDDAPYVFTANLFDDNGTSFLYSFLRSKDFSSGIDPITRKAWGLSETNGNSDGYGYFNRSALFQSVDKHYSQLPAIGDWHIIKNFLVRKADNPLSEAHNSMLNIRPLIPLEFNGSTPAYGCGFDNDIFLTYHNGELWGRGLYYIGRCYILPAVFDESGNPQEFYLYISPDYPRIAVAQADKFKLGILKTADNLYGFLTEQVSSLDNGLCYSSDNPKVFDASTKQWQQISESGQMFIDTLNHSGLVLNDDGAIFLNGASYECKGLKQWLAPAGVVEAVSEQSVISSFDNHAVATYPQQGFHRELLTGKKLPISAKSFSGKRLSLGLNDKTIQVNSSTGTCNAGAIAWENVYKQAVEIKLINSFTHSFIGNNRHCPIFITSVKSVLNTPVMQSDTVLGGTEQVIVDYISGGSGISPAKHGYYIDSPKSMSLLTSVSVSLFYIDIDTGRPVFLTIAASLPPAGYTTDPFGVFEYSCQPYLDVNYDTGQVGIGYLRAYNYLFDIEYCFTGGVALPNSLLEYSTNKGNISLTHVHMNNAVFSEKKSQAIFACKCLDLSNSSITDLFDYWNIQTLSDDETYCKKGLHIAVADNKNFFVFRSELYPEIFDFKSQTERSKLS